VPLDPKSEVPRPGAFCRLIALGLGLGYAPLAPGTAGSVLGLVLVWPLWKIGGWPAVLAGTVVVVAVGTWAAHGTAAWLGRKDPGPVVVDEVAGQMLALLFVTPTVPALVAGFLLFRVLDIVKPFPARQAEALPGGFGIMLDDLIAGAYANLALHGLVLLFPRGLGAG
jgi:phosphatidylglycerophosphatase A